MVSETYWQLLTNVPHWLFEITSDAVLGLALYPLIKRMVRRHDRTHHDA
jgi:hypothetical protein